MKISHTCGSLFCIIESLVIDIRNLATSSASISPIGDVIGASVIAVSVGKNASSKISWFLLDKEANNGKNTPSMCRSKESPSKIVLTA